MIAGLADGSVCPTLTCKGLPLPTGFSRLRRSRRPVTGMASPAVRGDDYLHIACQPYHLLDDSLAKRRRPLALPRPGQEQVSDAIEPREFDQSFCDIARLNEIGRGHV